VAGADTAALASLVARLETALDRLEQLGQTVPRKRDLGPLKIVPLPQFAAGELGPELDWPGDEPGPGELGELDELEADTEYAGESLGWEDDELARYSAASLAVKDAIETQLRLHGQLAAESLAAQLAEQYGLPGSDADLLEREIRSRIESDWRTVLEDVDTDAAGECSWRVTEPAEVCEACGISSLRDISGDAPAAWREMVGHWLYRQAVKHRGLSQAERAYGAFALLNYKKRLDWQSRGERGARISAGLKARQLVKSQGAVNG